MKNKGIIIFASILVICLVLMIFFLGKNENNNSNNENIGFYNYSELFTTRDLKQKADTSNAVTYTIKNNEDITINTAGVYVITGSSSETTIYVEAGSEDKVQLVLDGVNITNKDFPCIYVKSGDKVFVTTTNDSVLTVTDTFATDEDVKTNGVIFSRSDIVLNGEAKLTINSSYNGIVSKDDLKITGGSYDITAKNNGLRANDSIAIAEAILNINSGTDGLHAENSDDDKLGYIYIADGTININTIDDGIHAVSVVQINNGKINITAGEGIEGTYIQINGGDIDINATYDGINAANKSESFNTLFEMNDGALKINVEEKDSDAIDSNGNITINGGTIDISATLSFDYVGEAKLNGGKLIINGVEVSEIPSSSK